MIPTAEVPSTNLYRGEILDGNRLPLHMQPTHPVSEVKPAPTARISGDLSGSTSSTKWSLSVSSSPRIPMRSWNFSRKTPKPCCSDSAFTIVLSPSAPGTWDFRELKPMTWSSGCPKGMTTWRYPHVPIARTFKHAGPTSVFAESQKGSGIRSHSQWLGVALGRTVSAIFQSYQQADGSVLIPEALQPLHAWNGADHS